MVPKSRYFHSLDFWITCIAVFTKACHSNLPRIFWRKAGWNSASTSSTSTSSKRRGKLLSLQFLTWHWSMLWVMRRMMKTDSSKWLCLCLCFIFFFFEPQRVDVMGLLFLLSTFVAWENSVPILTAKGMRGTNNFSSHQKHILCKIYQNEKTIVFLGNEGNLHKWNCVAKRNRKANMFPLATLPSIPRILSPLTET